MQNLSTWWVRKAILFASAIADVEHILLLQNLKDNLVIIYFGLSGRMLQWCQTWDLLKFFSS